MLGANLRISKLNTPHTIKVASIDAGTIAALTTRIGILPSERIVSPSKTRIER